MLVQPDLPARVHPEPVSAAVAETVEVDESVNTGHGLTGHFHTETGRVPREGPAAVEQLGGPASVPLQHRRLIIRQQLLELNLGLRNLQVLHLFVFLGYSVLVVYQFVGLTWPLFL